MKAMTLAGLFGQRKYDCTCGLTRSRYRRRRQKWQSRVEKIPDAPKLALVKVADGFHDPVGVTAANDGSGRIFVVERAGRVRVVEKDGKVLPDPLIDLTNFNPLGSDVQTGFVEQGLWSIALHPKFKENGYVFSITHRCRLTAPPSSHG